MNTFYSTPSKPTAPELARLLNRLSVGGETRGTETCGPKMRPRNPGLTPDFFMQWQ